MIGTCKAKCVHPGQDSLHGVGKRVLNHRPSKEKGMDKYTCTVCKTEHDRGPVDGVVPVVSSKK